VDIGGAALVVSQFTLYGDARGQRRPSFVKAAPPDEANRLSEGIYDIVEGLQDLEEVVLANPLRTPNNSPGRLF
jgi:D-Tyr-tRNAtyr deacylase